MKMVLYQLQLTISTSSERSCEFFCLQHYSRNLHDPLILKQEQISIVKQISKPELIVEYLYIGHSL